MNEVFRNAAEVDGLTRAFGAADARIALAIGPESGTSYIPGLGKAANLDNTVDVSLPSFSR